MRVVQVVGFKNSGKTTLVSHLVEQFTSKNIRVATLKHHGHGGTPTVVEDSDSEKHRRAGAVMSGVQGAEVFQLTVEQPNWTIGQLISFYKWLDIDLLFIEGYKQLDFAKLVLVRDETDLHLLDQVNHIEAVVTNIKLTSDKYVVLNGLAQITDWLEGNMELFPTFQ